MEKVSWTIKYLISLMYGITMKIHFTLNINYEALLLLRVADITVIFLTICNEKHNHSIYTLYVEAECVCETLEKTYQTVRCQ